MSWQLRLLSALQLLAGAGYIAFACVLQWPPGDVLTAGLWVIGCLTILAALLVRSPATCHQLLLLLSRSPVFIIIFHAIKHSYCCRDLSPAAMCAAVYLCMPRWRCWPHWARLGLCSTSS